MKKEKRNKIKERKGKKENKRKEERKEKEGKKERKEKESKKMSATEFTFQNTNEDTVSEFYKQSIT